MMRLFAIIITTGFLLGTALSARASVIGSLVVPNVANTFEDGSRETVFDTGTAVPVGPLSGDNRFSVGDVIAGIVEIRLVNSTDISHPDHIYGVFSQQVASIVPNGTNFDVFFAPTTVAGLTLSDLTGQAQPAGGFVAVYTAAGGYGSVGQIGSPTINSLLTNPPDVPVATSSIKDYISFIVTNGTREMVIGVRAGQVGVGLAGPTLAQPDYFHAITSDIGSSLVTIGYSQTSVLTTGQQVATIDFGLSILVSPPDVIFGNTGFGSTGLGTTIQYQALLSSAAARGASNDPLYPRFSTAGNDFAAALDTSGGFQDNGTFQVTPTQIIPEPASFLLFSGLGFVWLAGAGFRRRKISS